MTHDDIMMFAFGLFLFVVGPEGRVELPDDAGDLEKCITKIDGAFLGRDGIFDLVFTGFIDRGIQAAERNQSVSGAKAGNITNLTEDHTCRRISNTGDREDIRANLINIKLYLRIVCGDPLLNVFEFIDGIGKLKGIPFVRKPHGMLGGIDQLFWGALASAVQQSGNLADMRLGELFRTEGYSFSMARADSP